MALGKAMMTRTTEKVPTRFDRVIHAIQYLNHWQNVYLETNAQIEQMSESQRGQGLEKLGHIKRVNEQLSDMLNTIRDHEYHLWDDFKKNDFELFFQKFGIIDWHEQFKTLNHAGQPAEIVKSEEKKEASLPEPSTMQDQEKPETTEIRNKFQSIIEAIEEEDDDIDTSIARNEWAKRDVYSGK